MITSVIDAVTIENANTKKMNISGCFFIKNDCHGIYLRVSGNAKTDFKYAAKKIDYKINQRYYDYK